MKKCPMCGSAAPDEAAVCYECLYSFELMSCVAMEPMRPAAAEQSPASIPRADEGSVPPPADTAPIPALCLEVRDAEFGIRMFDINSGSLYVGRLPTNEIVIDDATVSRRHIHIFVEGGRLYVEDLDATNPARLNGKTIAGRSELVAGDALSIRDATIEVQSLSRGRMPIG